jgi:hypothetical protein
MWHTICPSLKETGSSAEQTKPHAEMTSQGQEHWGVNSLLPDFPEETWIKKCWKVLSYIFCADVGDS